MSLRPSSYVASKLPKDPKTLKGPFPSNIALRLKKVCYNVSLCENCQRQSNEAFISLTIRAKIIGRGDPLYLKFSIKVTAFERNRRFVIAFRSYSHSAITLTEGIFNEHYLRMCTTRFPMSPRWTSYVVPNSLKGGLTRWSAIAERSRI